MSNPKIVITPHIPTYEQAHLMLPVFNGLEESDIRELINIISEQTGTPQKPVDWSDPEKWIPERLDGRNLELAQIIWEKSHSKVNPRHLRGIYWFIIRHELVVNESGSLIVTQKGKLFLEGSKTVIKDIDEIEGISYLLSLLATKTRAQRKDLLPDWSDFLILQTAN